MRKVWDFTALRDLSQTGFTLFELLIVLAVIGLLYLVLLASYTRYVFSRRLEADARRIASDLRWAHQAALTKHLNYTVDFYTNDESYSISNGSSISRQLSMDLSSVSPSSTITFYPAGNASQATTITLEDPNEKTLTITVAAATGGVSIQ